MPLLTPQERSGIQQGTKDEIPPVIRGERLNKSVEEQRGWLGSSAIFPRRRPVPSITEELGGGGSTEELPVRGEGETEGNLGIADRPKVPRLSNQEQTLLMRCERPLDMEE